MTAIDFCKHLKLTLRLDIKFGKACREWEAGGSTAEDRNPRQQVRSLSNMKFRSVSDNSPSRYDMLCHEGISLMLNIFREKTTMPNFRVVAPQSGELHQITVNPEVKIRLPNNRI